MLVITTVSIHGAFVGQTCTNHFQSIFKLDLGRWQKLVFSPKEETAIRGPEHWAQQCKPREEEARIFAIFMSVHGYILKPFTKKLVSLGKIS